jgi:FkbM family methyltransferase
VIPSSAGPRVRPQESRLITLLKASFRHLPPRGRDRLAIGLGFKRFRAERWLSLGFDLIIPATLREVGPRREVIYGPAPAWQLSWDLVRPGDRVVDVGANIGLWGLRSARLVGPDGNVHAFEPLPLNADRLRANAAINDLENLYVHRIALADRCESAPFFAPSPEDSGKGRLAPGDGLRGGLEVELATLDSLRGELGLERIALLKLDVEGAEGMVIDGAEETLAGDEAPIVLFEAAEKEASLLGSSCEAVKKALEDHGYAVYRYRENRLEPAGSVEQTFWEDLFALKESHIATHRLLQGLVRG